MSAPRGKEIGKPKPGSCGQGGGGGGSEKCGCPHRNFHFFVIWKYFLSNMNLIYVNIVH